MKKLGIVGPIDGRGKQIIKEGLADLFTAVEVSNRQEYELLADADAIVLRTLDITAADLTAMPQLRHIQRWGAGYDAVDIEAAGERGIAVTVAAGVNAPQVSEYVVLLAMAVYRNIIQVDRNVREGRWRDSGLISRSYSLAGKTVGLVGLGNIGKMVAEKVQAFRANVIYHDLRRLEAAEEAALGVSFRPLERLAEEADVLSVHVPLTAGTRNLIDAAFLRRMKKTAILVNTARGGIVDEAALYDALAGGALLGAGLDVFAQEPVEAGNPLLSLGNVVLSSHFGGNTADLSLATAERCVENIRTVAQGGLPTPPDLVNAQYLRKAASSS